MAVFSSLVGRIFSPLKLWRLQALSDRLVRGDKDAGKTLTRRGTAWQIAQADLQTLAIKVELAPLQDRLKSLTTEATRQNILWTLTHHLLANCEHIAPRPVLVTASEFYGNFLVQSRDFGPGLGKYLDHVGFPFSTRSYERQRQFTLELQGNGLLLRFNQVLNGCWGRVVIESGGQRVALVRRGLEIIGRRQPLAEFVGTRVSFYLPQREAWVYQPDGFCVDDLPPPLTINWLKFSQ